MSTGFATSASAGPAAAPPDGQGPTGPGKDNLDHPLGTKQAELRAQGLQMKLNGKLPRSARTAKVGKGQFVELTRDGEDSIWTVLGEFGPDDHPAPVLQSGVPGPLHNEIPEPDRAEDNTTIWTADFSREYYEKLLFSEEPGAVSMRNFYIEESSNRYTVNGEVADWVQVPYNAAAYGRNYCGDIVCAQTWVFVNHSIDAWYNAQVAAGRTTAEINADLAQFDVWDRYDYDGDGNFDEPDGYIDHFQSVHAGEGEETGGGAQGTDAIWSHRWYAYYSANGPDGTGPHDYGGIRIGNSDYWIGDYTIEPENGGVGVFTHEFGHDLGLPDLYDTSGNTGGAENSTGFWTLYSSGSYGSTGKPEDGIGSKPIPMSAYEKIFLGWSNYQVVGYGQRAAVRLGPASTNTKATQQLVTLLPDKQVEFPVGTPYSGDFQYFSGSGNDLDNTMTRSVTLPSGTVGLTAKVKYDIEIDPGWTYDGFIRAGATVEQSFFNAYFAEYRTYRGYDDGLRTGPCNFGFPDTKPNWVEHFPYQDGLLVWYYDTSFADNNVGDNCAGDRCGGMFLPVDAHPELLLRPDDGQVWRPRMQSYDSTFGTDPTDRICLHTDSTTEQCYGGLPGNPLFDDTESYWVAPDDSIGHEGWSSVPLPATGTTIRVANTSTLGDFMQVLVNR